MLQNEKKLSDFLSFFTIHNLLQNIIGFQCSVLSNFMDIQSLGFHRKKNSVLIFLMLEGLLRLFVIFSNQVQRMKS